MGARVEIKKRCAYCEKEYIARKVNTIYCSHNCNRKDYKQKKREEKLKLIDPQIIQGKQNEEKHSILDSKEFMNIQDLAELLGVSYTTAYRYCASGKINCVKLNQKIFVRRKDIDEIFEKSDPYEISPAQEKDLSEWYTSKEVQEKYGISKTSFFYSIRNKNIPRVYYRGRTLYNKAHVDLHLRMKAPNPEITEWYTTEEIMNKYHVSKSVVYSTVCEHGVERKSGKNKTYYAKSEIDNLFKHRITHHNMEDWYTMEDVTQKYSVKPSWVAQFVYKNSIPKIRVSGKSKYSKKEFDEKMRERGIIGEYYTVPEAMEKFNIKRDSLYYYIRVYNIPRIKEGQTTKILKSALDDILEPKLK